MPSQSREQMAEQLFELAREAYELGPGYAQEGHVLRNARNKFGLKGVRQEQMVLDCWHELFRSGRLVWGYNIDNPQAPFFHIPEPAAVS